MTEQQWLTSTNPAEMVAFLGERITDEHQRLYFEACRKERDAEYSRAKNSDWEVPAALRADILRDIVGNPFVIIESKSILGGYIRDRNPVTRLGERLARFDDAWLQWNDGTIPKMVDAMMNEDCDKCIIRRGERYVFAGPDSHWEPCGCTNGRIPRAEPRWEMMLEIADALEEGAGCREQAILEHLRDATCVCRDYEWRSKYSCKVCECVPDEYGWARHGKGCFRMGDENGGGEENFDFDCGCNGTGRIKRRHWKGCHVIELYLKNLKEVVNEENYVNRLDRGIASNGKAPR